MCNVTSVSWWQLLYLVFFSYRSSILFVFDSCPYHFSWQLLLIFSCRSSICVFGSCSIPFLLGSWSILFLRDSCSILLFLGSFCFSVSATAILFLGVSCSLLCFLFTFSLLLTTQLVAGKVVCFGQHWLARVCECISRYFGFILQGVPKTKNWRHLTGILERTNGHSIKLSMEQIRLMLLEFFWALLPRPSVFLCTHILSKETGMSHVFWDSL